MAFLMFCLLSCSKEDGASQSCELQVKAVLNQRGTKASLEHSDGQAAEINEWVVEVRDVEKPGEIYYREVKPGEKGKKEQTFNLFLSKDHVYDIAFWAHKSGCYLIDDLSQVRYSSLDKIGNSDTFDSFSTCIRFLAEPGSQISAELRRPLAQVNIVTNDLPGLKAGSTKEAYLNYEPKNYVFRTLVPTSFNAFTGKASNEQLLTIVPLSGADRCYGNYEQAAELTKIFMTYVLSDSAEEQNTSEVRNIDFSFKTGSVQMNYNFSSIPVKRNRRTNIIGGFLANAVTWEVVVLPDWDGQLND